MRTANAEREKEVESLRQTQYLMDRLASDSNDTNVKTEKLLKERSKLESQVRELQGELSRCQVVVMPPPKTPVRPRSSSLSNINKVVQLERNIEQMQASASASQLEANSAKEKLSKAKSDLLMVENEKAALEKRLRDMDSSLRRLTDDQDELQREIEFLRAQGSSSREQDLMDRLEHEEARASLLEKELAQMSRVRNMKSSVDRLTAQLQGEVSKREAAEFREIEITQEREEALNELHDLRQSMDDLRLSLEAKNSYIHDLEGRNRYAWNLLDRLLN